ncbi:MAG TPA: poly-gamma-glutamate hydrolase family protein [Gammaproteobacteria bacterium]|nr:poly-gamma-glutamate hydrolase family protein [Gammaproteobacteria bacterium]
MDRYNCFEDLRQCETEGRDYRIRLLHGKSVFSIMAPHGGRIERGTSQLAESIAGEEHTFYAFEGIKDKNNHHLHITSDYFDEPNALQLVKKVQTVITVHGARGKQHAIYTGGLNQELEKHILQALSAAGFTAMHDPSPTRQGRGVTNICNRGRDGKGVQLELTQGLRKQLFDQICEGQWMPNELFREFVQTLRMVLADSEDTF